MTDDISPLVQVASKVAAPLVSIVGKEIFRRLTDDSAASKAIATTCEAFDDIEGLRGFLITWCQSEDFWVLIERLYEGDRELTDRNIAAKFVSVTGFYMAADTESVAEDVLQEFMKNLEYEVYLSKEGTALLAKQIQSGSKHSMEQLRALRMQATETQDVLKQIAAFLMPEDATSSPRVQELVLDGRVDAARRLIHNGQARSARTELLEIREEAEKFATSTQLRFRITTNTTAALVAASVAGGAGNGIV